MPRQRRRKAAPERVPPMMSPIKSLYGRRTTAGIINIPSVSGCGFLPTSATSFLLPGKGRGNPHTIHLMLMLLGQPCLLLPLVAPLPPLA